MPDRLEMELSKAGDLPLTPLGLEKMRPDLGGMLGQLQESYFKQIVQRLLIPSGC